MCTFQIIQNDGGYATLEDSQPVEFEVNQNDKDPFTTEVVTSRKQSFEGSEMNGGEPIQEAGMNEQPRIPLSNAFCKRI